ncbi:MAG: MFS transporter [Opitutus sp.]|nr:MFS transporter [Opitutus sp.]
MKAEAPAGGATHATAAALLRERFDLSQGKAGLTATATLQIASFCGILLGGALSDFLSARDPRARMLVPAWGYLAAAPALLLLASSHVLLIALAGLVVYGVARGFFDANLMPMVRQSVDERYSATAYGFLNLIGCFTGGAMTYAGGSLRDAGLNLSIAFGICAGGILVTGLILHPPSSSGLSPRLRPVRPKNNPRTPTSWPSTRQLCFRCYHAIFRQREAKGSVR